MCKNGNKALANCKFAEIDLLYLDYELGPSITGYEFLKELVERFNNPPKSVICISMHVLCTALIEEFCMKHAIPYEYLPPPEDAFMTTGHYG